MREIQDGRVDRSVQVDAHGLWRRWPWVRSAAAPSRGARGGRRGAADAAPTSRACTGDVDRLKQELRDQRQLIFQLMQVEQQRYDMILKYLQVGRAGCDASRDPAAPSPAAAEAAEARRRAERRAEAGGRRRRRRARARHGLRPRAHQRPADRRGLRLRRRDARRAGARAHAGDQAARQAVLAARGGGAGRDAAHLPQPGHRSFTTCSRVGRATASTSARSRGARRRRRSCCSSRGRSRSSATSTRRCARTCWWSRTRTGRGCRRDGSFQHLRRPGRAAARSSSGARR